MVGGWRFCADIRADIRADSGPTPADLQAPAIVETPEHFVAVSDVPVFDRWSESPAHVIAGGAFRPFGGVTG